MATKPLWDYSHPYLATPGCYYSNDNHHEYDSWEEFLEDYGDLDQDLNLLYRWDWELDEYRWDWDREGPAGELLQLYYIAQRKAYPFSVYVKVTRDDEPEIRKWLEARAQKIRDLWAPLLGGGEDE